MGKRLLSNPLAPPNSIKQARLSIIRIFNSSEQVIGVISLAKVVLDVIILSWNTQLDKLILKCS